jgi:hypothetical protein
LGRIQLCSLTALSSGLRLAGRLTKALSLLLSDQRTLPLGHGICLLVELFESALFRTVVESRLGLGLGFLGGSYTPSFGLDQAAVVCLALTVGPLFPILRVPSGFPSHPLGLFFSVGDPTVGLSRPALGRFAQRLCAFALTRRRAQARAVLQ